MRLKAKSPIKNERVAPEVRSTETTEAMDKTPNNNLDIAPKKGDSPEEEADPITNIENIPPQPKEKVEENLSPEILALREEVFGKKAKEEDRSLKLYRMANKYATRLKIEKALELYLTSCQLGHLQGCHRYGWYQAKYGKFATAKRFFKLSCEKGILKSCNNLGWYEEKLGNISSAQNYYSLACLKMHPGSCTNLRRVEDIARQHAHH